MRAATAPLAARATPTITSTVAPISATTAANCSAPIPISAGSRPRTRRQASPTVMVDPNTARATTTVSIPESRIVPNAVAAAEISVKIASPVLSSFEGPRNCTSRASAEVTATTAAVSPRVAFGLALMYPTAPRKMSPSVTPRVAELLKRGITPGFQPQPGGP